MRTGRRSLTHCCVRRQLKSLIYRGVVCTVDVDVCVCGTRLISRQQQERMMMMMLLQPGIRRSAACTHQLHFLSARSRLCRRGE